jgi:hypothetical protein
MQKLNGMRRLAGQLPVKRQDAQERLIQVGGVEGQLQPTTGPVPPTE